ncbi:hypothetical protein ACSU6B_23225 [Neobacillus sp. C211]|uniref:hypothetical protein n=1 Tax=unclassified Neobacillus TaxID=2675272 RepID=UPI00397AFA10
MAQKKNANAAAQNEATEQTVEAQGVKLTEAEMDAIQVQEQVTAGEQPTGKYKLKDPETQFSDAASGFTLAGDQEKELPEDPSPELLARIRSGFIKKA